MKGGWTEGQAGGSPNNATFTNNPQYSLSFKESDKPINILIQLVQESAHYEEASIGFLVIKAKNGMFYCCNLLLYELLLCFIRS